MGWGDGMGGRIPKLPPAPFLCGVCVCHTVPLGVTRSPRCAAPWDLGQLLRPGAPLGRGAPWSTSGCGTPMGPRAPLGARAPWVLEHPRSWSTHLGHARSWSSQWDLVLQLRAGLSHTSPFPQKGTLGSFRPVPAHPACKDPPGAPSSTAASPLHWALTWGSASPHHHQEKSPSLVETQHRRSVRSLHHSRAPGAAAPNPRPCRNAAGELLRAASRRCHSQIPADGIDRVSWKGPTKITRSY